MLRCLAETLFLSFVNFLPKGHPHRADRTRRRDAAHGDAPDLRWKRIPIARMSAAELRHTLSSQPASAGDPKASPNELKVNRKTVARRSRMQPGAAFQAPPGGEGKASPHHHGKRGGVRPCARLRHTHEFHDCKQLRPRMRNSLDCSGAIGSPCAHEPRLPAAGLVWRPRRRSGARRNVAVQILLVDL